VVYVLCVWYVWGRCIREGKMESGIMPLDETLQIMRTMDNIRTQLGLKYSNE